MEIKISPSMLASDFSRLGEEGAAMERAGADYIHMDVMDGHFVPNLSLGVPVVAGLKKRLSVPMDVHLMLTHPLKYVEAFAQAGAGVMTFHMESCSPVAETIETIKGLGVRPGLVLKPGTPAEAVEPYLSLVDYILVMTVEPGFGGQAFQPEMLPKIEAIRRAALKRGVGLDLEVDGGIDLHTAPLVAASGANVLVAGSALFAQADYGRAVEELRRAARRGWRKAGWDAVSGGAEEQ